MPLLIILAVLCGAFLHASWNALVKAAPDKALNMGLVAGGAALICAVLLLFMPFPAQASWPFLAASLLLTIAYYFLLAAVYGVLDMSQAYPIMRGTAPFLVALASGPLIGEKLPLTGWVGITLICCGVGAISLVNKKHGGMDRAAIRFALFNALIIAACTVLDSLGARRSGHPLSYAASVYLLSGFPMPFFLWLRRPGFTAYAKRYWSIGLLGGAATFLSYAIALWAMTRAPVASVAALRESSILFAGAISAICLQEKVGARRAIASSVIALGVAVMKFV